MRRVATVLAGLAAAGSLTLALAVPAWAAEGVLVINDEPHENPSGCYTVEPGHVSIINDTDKPASVHRTTNCSGRALVTLQPGQDTELPFARSVSIA